MSELPSAPTRAELFSSLDAVPLAQVRRFRRRIAKANSAAARSAIAADIAAAREKVALIDAAIPPISYPAALPVSARRDDIAAAIAAHQVVIIAGETGSGKTTQIPKICLELGRGRRGLIGHTQPRRLAARTVAERIAEELGQGIGESVGYAIRFDDSVTETTAVKLMTDGILLAEMQRDRFLNAYDTIIIDEAHERSLNIDFLLGYLKRLLPSRPDLKVIITSATIDPERFAAHFADESDRPAPIIEVSGRTYPVEIRYRPLERESGQSLVEIDPLDGLCEAIEELMAEGEGDILCFFPGERDIRDAMEAIEARAWRGVEVTPLFGRLSNQEQHRVFSSHRGRRIVLATNIAETSLTVPGIRYVVDTGTARISRYSTRTKVQRLPIEPISQASANQRSGRCGRVADGIAIRLYSEQDFLTRPEFSDPEILRTNLASVILQMISLRLGDISQFPFVEPPAPKAIRDGVALLHELGALKPGEEDRGMPVLSPIGKDLARIPVDPRMARMLVEAQRVGCLDDVIVIVAAMSIQDVRERPLDKAAQADQAHARFRNPDSDFLSTLTLWDFVKDSRQELSGNAFRRRMKAEFLHYMRIREWFDLVRQLRDVAKQLGWRLGGAGERRPDSIHTSLLAGLLSNIGARVGNSKEFQGARGTRFMVFPGSSLAKKPPAFLMAAELVETSRLWARDVASIDPAWVERLAADLLKHQYSDPAWSRKRAAGVVKQRSTLYGVPIVVDRTVAYQRVDPAAAREMFIRHGLVEGDWDSHHRFLRRNAQALEEAEQYEEKARRRGIVVSEDDLFDFYDSRVPAHVCSGRSFDSWWKKKRQGDPELLDFDPAALVSDSHEVTEADFPESWRKGSIDYELTYKFSPGDPLDGVTVKVPIPLLAGFDAEGFDWLVPGMRAELVTELIRSLPKGLRRTLVPAPDFAERALPRLIPYESPLTEQLADVLRTLGAQGIAASDFRPESLPPHLRMNFGAVDRRGKIVDSDRDLGALVDRQAGHITSSVSRAGKKEERAAARKWTEESIGTVAEEVKTVVDGHEVTAYPALVASPQGVALKVHPTRAAADAAMMTTTLSLLMADISVNNNQMIKGLPLQQRVAVDAYPHGGAAGLISDARVAAIRDLMLEHGGPVRSPQEFDKLKAAVRPEVPGRVHQAVISLAPALVEYSHLRAELAEWEGPAINDMQGQLDFLLPAQAITIHGMSHLRHLPRYLQAMRIRLEEMSLDPDRDADRQSEVDEAKAYLRNKLRSLPAGREKSRPVKEIFWMIEELRVSLFAQRLGTARPVSLRRIRKEIDKLN